jgi:aminoglycoside 6'-N-acetyltransferase I
MRIRRAELRDAASLVEMRCLLWPDGTTDEHRADAEALLAGRPRTTLPLVVFVADADDKVVGFVEVGLRSHADGCDAAQPCGFVEGWFVDGDRRRRGVGKALIAAAEAWCIEQGCREIASDTWIDADVSQHAHRALGFEVVDRCVNFRKSLEPKGT